MRPTSKRTVRRAAGSTICAIAVIASVVPGARPAGAAPTLPIIRVSVNPTGGNPTGFSISGDLTADGRYAVFASEASNVVPGDTNGAIDVFVRDLVTNRTERVSVSDGEAQSSTGKDSWPGAISDDGRYVTFTSDATNLVPGDTNGVSDVFVRDLVSKKTTRVSVTSAEGQLSATTWGGAASSDATKVVFQSAAAELGGPGDPGPFASGDLFVRDLTAGTTTIVSAPVPGESNDGSSTGIEDISDDGRFVLFWSTSQVLVADQAPEDQLFLRDLTAGTTTQLPGYGDGVMSADGRIVFYQAYDGSRDPQIYRWDRLTNSRSMLTTTDDQVFLRMESSADGKTLVFESANTPAGPRDGGSASIFALDVASGARRRVSVKRDGTAVDDRFMTDLYAISEDGRFVLFSTDAPGLVPNDTNISRDLFRADLALVPDVPTSVRVESSGATPTVRWTAPKPNGRGVPTGYRIKVFEGGIDESPDQVIETGSTATSRTLTTLAPGRSYRFAVAARNTAGDGADSEYSQVIVPPWRSIDAYSEPLGPGDGAVPYVFWRFAGRAPTSAEIGQWANTILRSTTGVNQMIRSTSQAAWTRTNVEPVIRLYSAFFARRPDTAGLSYWSGRRSSGTTLIKAAETFARSSEFARRYGSLNDRAFVQRAYLNVLGRNPDASGWSYWTRKLGSGTPRGQVMLDLSESSENVKRRQPTVDLTKVTFGLLGRVPTDAELAEGLDQPLGATIDRLLASSDLAARVG